MPEDFEWKVEIVYKGNPAEFANVRNALQSLQKVGLMINYPDWGILHGPFPGIPPIDLQKSLSPEVIKSLTAKAITHASLRDIYGGIRDPHFHLGSDVFLLDRASFRELATNVASGLVARRIDANEDFTTVMKGMTGLIENK